MKAGSGVHIDVEGRLIELYDIDAVGSKPAYFLVEEVGKGEGHLHAVAVIGVGDGVDDGHRPRQGEFELAPRVGAGDPRLVCVDAATQRQRARDGRHHRLVALLADAHFDTLGEVDAVHEFEEAVDEMLARLLAIGDDVDAGILLNLDGEKRRVALAGFEIGSRSPGLR